MCAHHIGRPHVPGASMATWFAWLGGGDRREPDDSHARSAQSITGVVVLINVALTWLATTLAIWPTMHRWAPAVVPFTLVFALLVGATARVVATEPPRTARRGSAVVAVALALVLGGATGEFATLALFSSAVDGLIQQGAQHNAASAPAVAQETTSVERLRDARAALDHAVDAARAQRDEALVVARCEYHPTPACPQTRITGVPGSGPETRTANELLVDSQRELDQAQTTRDLRAPELDARIRDGERAVDQARQHATSAPDHGIGTRWVALQQLTWRNVGILMLHVLTVGFFVFLGLLPLILRQWRGDTSRDRQAQARDERERAELAADTAIAVKRAEVRAAVETMWAEQQLAQARLAIEAQTEIDRAQLRQRVSAAIEAAAPDPKPSDDDLYLPIAAEAHAASLGATHGETANLPALPEPRDTPKTPALQTIPDATRAAARWIRPLVPGFVGRAIDTSTHPFRTARQVIEEVEHITFSLTRTRRVTVEADESADSPSVQGRVAGATSARDRVLAVGGREQQRTLTDHERGRLAAADGPPQLPPVGQ